MGNPSGVLLALDGDSLAHRAYHALPSTIRTGDGGPANALVGFSNFLLTLWTSEAPVAVLAAFDSLSSPTYRQELLPGYQAGREFDESILSQLEQLPALAAAFGCLVAKAPGYEADDFLAAAAASWPDRVSVVTSDRDAFQLVSERVSVLQPLRGVSELARIGPGEVMARYGVEPAQVPDFIALRGDPSDRIPGARGVGAKTAASLLKQYGTLEGLLAAGRFAPVADDLRTYRRVAEMDASAPLPELSARQLDRAGAERWARTFGLNGLAERLSSGA